MDRAENGSAAVNCIAGGGGCVERDHSRIATVTAIVASAMIATYAIQPANFGRAGAVSGCAVDSHLNSSFTSSADWNRSSGLLARQVLTSRSRAAGDVFRTALTGCGSSSRIALATLICDLPSKGRLPVAIS